MIATYGVATTTLNNETAQIIIIDSGMKHPQGAIATASSGVSPEMNVTYTITSTSAVHLVVHNPSPVSGAVVVSWCVFGTNTT